MAIPAQFENVTAVCKANIYFDGKVVSHAIVFADGSRKTLGLIYPGEFHFGTGAPERMELVAGACRIKIDGTADWKSFKEGEFFDVPGNSGFDIAVEGEIMEYICSYLS